MARSGGRRLCALTVVVALLTAPLAGPRSAPGCHTCAPDCPMHARRVGCHHAPGQSCHRGSDVPLLRATCGHAERGLAPETLRATLVPPVAPCAVDVALFFSRPAPPPRIAPLLEPPTDPPRTFARPI